jgi:bifunctional non-homologous end joining protein LigD
MSEPLLPAFIQPMLAVSAKPFDDANFLFEIKWDGIRMLAFIDTHAYRLINRHGTDTTARYPEFDFLAQLPSGTVLDGEMVVLRNGQPDFVLVQSRDKTRSSLKIRTLSRAEPATFMAFDLLYENYNSLVDYPLLERRQRLERFLDRCHHPRLVFSPGVVGQGQALFAAACGQNLEGIMAKRLTSRYRPGQRSRAWIKIKPPSAIPSHRQP